jgi:hypothetical protein
MGLGWKRNGCLSAPSANMRCDNVAKCSRRHYHYENTVDSTAQTRRDDYAVKTCAGTGLPCFVGGVADRLTGVDFDYWCSIVMTPAKVWLPWASQVVPAQSEQRQAHEP